MLAPSETCSRPSHDEMNENVPNENGAAGWTLSEATVFSMVDPSDPNSTTEKDSDANGNAESALKNNTPLAASAAEPTAVTTEPAAVVSAVTTETLENHVQRPEADPPVDPPIDDTQMEEQSQGEGDNVVQSLPTVTPPVETKNVSELETLPVQQQQQQLPSASSQIVIDLLDDDDDDDEDLLDGSGDDPELSGHRNRKTYYNDLVDAYDDTWDSAAGAAEAPLHGKRSSRKSSKNNKFSSTQSASYSMPGSGVGQDKTSTSTNLVDDAWGAEII
mmetsp:Transcript_9907/g.18022  ORF Transcript_9907/g.18022 Transcript_9907/m.18022 type:complete len:275 (-) Transcript_9907:233-1057(-)